MGFLCPKADRDFWIATTFRSSWLRASRVLAELVDRARQGLQAGAEPFPTTRRVASEGARVAARGAGAGPLALCVPGLVGRHVGALGRRVGIGLAADHGYSSGFGAGRAAAPTATSRRPAATSATPGLAPAA